jgi:hypothetical protein
MYWSIQEPENGIYVLKRVVHLVETCERICCMKIYVFLSLLAHSFCLLKFHEYFLIIFEFIHQWSLFFRFTLWFRFRYYVKITVFWDVMPCCLLYSRRYQHFTGICCFCFTLLLSRKLKQKISLKQWWLFGKLHRVICQKTVYPRYINRIVPSILCILFIVEPHFLSFSHVHVAGLCYIILHINSGACSGTALPKINVHVFGVVTAEHLLTYSLEWHQTVWSSNLELARRRKFLALSQRTPCFAALHTHRVIDLQSTKFI